MGTLLICNVAHAQNFVFPTSGDAVNNELAPLTAADGVTMLTSIRSSGCAPGGSSTFRFSAAHVSSGAIYRNTSWAINCSGSRDMIKMDFSTKSIRPQGLKFSIYDVDNGSDSVSVSMYRNGVALDYTYQLFSPTFVTAHGASPSFGFVGSANNNSGLDDNRGTIEITTTDLMTRVDSIIIFKYNNRDISGNPSQSFAGFQWTNYVVLPVKILTFNAVHRQGGVDFSWMVAGESGTEKYQLEYAANGADFRAVGNPVYAYAAAAGNSFYTNHLPDLAAGTVSFFRLQARDNNGKSIYSPIVKINPAGQLAFTVQPTVFKDQVTVSFESATNSRGYARLIGMDGGVHFFQALLVRPGSNSFLLQLPPSLAPGIYTLQFGTERGIANRQVIVKQ
jgi:hypothetical protein